MNPWGTILGVWAHPDDETYVSAAHMMRALGAGDRVVCVTASYGELGSPDEVRWPPGGDLAKVRSQELDAALAVLGVTEHHWLDYPDGGCAQVPLAEGAARIHEQLQAVRPDTVMTFGPDGGTGHPDHISVSRWVDAALTSYDGHPPTLLWATDSSEWVAEWRAALEPLGVFLGNEPVSVPRADLRSYLRLTPDEVDRKLRALLCQVSQVTPMVDELGIEQYALAIAEEGFR